MNHEPAGSNDPIHLQYTLSSREIRLAWWAAQIRSPLVWGVLVSVAMFTAALALLGAIGSAPPASTSAEWFAALLLFPVLSLVFLVMMLLLDAALVFVYSPIASRQLRQQEVVIDDAGVSSKTAKTESRIDWKVVPRAVEFRAAYSLSKGRSKFLIPKRVFATADSEEQFRSLCAKHCKTKLAGPEPTG